MELAKAIALFIVGLVLLIKGGDWFVDGAVAISRRFHLPELLIGATIVSIGTTLPEVMVSAGAATIGNGGMAYGNAIGSVICNTSLISALTIAIRPTAVHRRSLRTPVIFFFIAATFYCTLAYAGGYFSRVSGIILLSCFLIYMVITVRQTFKTNASETGEEQPHEGELLPLRKSLVMLVLGAACIAIGADLLVDNGTYIAETLGVPQTVISLTFVALGTSLPELVTAITSLAKGHSSLSVGNIIGANLFNLVLVSGIATTISPFNIGDVQTKQAWGMNASLVIDLPVMMIVMLIMTVPTLIKGRLERWQGVTLLGIYAGFCVFQFCC